jgi:hypothetical protein
MARASTLSARVATLEREVARLRRLVEPTPAQRNGKGRRPRPAESGAGPHPFSGWAGWLRDDPMFDAWQEAIAAYRRERDADEDAP